MSIKFETFLRLKEQAFADKGINESISSKEAKKILAEWIEENGGIDNLITEKDWSTEDKGDQVWNFDAVLWSYFKSLKSYKVRARSRRKSQAKIGDLEVQRDVTAKDMEYKQKQAIDAAIQKKTDQISAKIQQETNKEKRKIMRKKRDEFVKSESDKQKERIDQEIKEYKDKFITKIQKIKDKDDDVKRANEIDWGPTSIDMNRKTVEIDTDAKNQMESDKIDGYQKLKDKYETSVEALDNAIKRAKDRKDKLDKDKLKRLEVLEKKAEDAKSEAERLQNDIKGMKEDDPERFEAIEKIERFHKFADKLTEEIEQIISKIEEAFRRFRSGELLLERGGNNDDAIDDVTKELMKQAGAAKDDLVESRKEISVKTVKKAFKKEESEAKNYLDGMDLIYDELMNDFKDNVTDIDARTKYEIQKKELIDKGFSTEEPDGDEEDYEVETIKNTKDEEEKYYRLKNANKD